MTKDLERDLGLPSVMAISIGAMVGSGIFILPGLALKIAGPAVILAYLLAALLVLPAALSKSEMATAMPQSGGTYLYIERGMGPLLGTIAGVGTWFSLTFKGALALVGGAPYLLILFDLPVRPVAVVAGVVLILVNLLGAKQTGRLQVVIVALMLGALTYFVAGSATGIDTANYDGFFAEGAGGLLAATGFVFVSYAGVTKIASVAEEVENPDRNLPLGMLGSLAFTTLLYIALVVVMIGVVPAEELKGSNVPMKLAAEETLAGLGVGIVVVAAVIALVSTANAGILSSSRYPLAMSRDSLVPPSLAEVSDRFDTPVQAITLTGAVLLLMVAFVPITEIAKLASAFKIVVFVLINVALVAFREADLESYDPSFETPLYPFPQAVGIVGGLALLPFMGLVPVVGALVITVGSLLWYVVYVRRQEDIDREGAATDAIRQRLGDHSVAQTASVVTDEDGYDVFVAVTERTDPERESRLVEAAIAVARARDGAVHVTRFDEVPDQTPLERATQRQTPGDRSFEQRMDEHATDAELQFDYEEVVSHETRHAIVNHADRFDADAIVLERRGEQLHTPVFGSDVGWIKRHTDRDVLEIEDRGIESVETISVVSDRGVYDAAKIALADSLAVELDADLELLFGIDPSAPDSQRTTTEEYLSGLLDRCEAPASTRLVEHGDRAAGLIDATRETDLVVIGAGRSGLRGALLGRPTDRIVDGSDRTAVVVSAGEPRVGWVRRLLENRVF